MTHSGHRNLGASLPLLTRTRHVASGYSIASNTLNKRDLETPRGESAPIGTKGTPGEITSATLATIGSSAMQIAYVTLRFTADVFPRLSSISNPIC
jgi:hypothetical protein